MPYIPYCNLHSAADYKFILLKFSRNIENTLKFMHTNFYYPAMHTFYFISKLHELPEQPSYVCLNRSDISKSGVLVNNCATLHNIITSKTKIRYGVA